MARLVDPTLLGVQTRPTVIDWPNQVAGIVAGYNQFRGIAHGVQKDLVQNSWDARKNRRGNGWGVTFELVEAKGITLFVMTDRGTTGLTGRILTPEELEDKDLPEVERWGRFESLAFTKPVTETSQPLGSRGRGKFIFVGASKESTILYDSLREDGTYRFGFRTVERTQSPVAAFDEEEGKKMLTKISKGLLEPLSQTGTRVVIVNPIDELVNAVKTGEFLKYISETWWEIIQKFGAQMILKACGKEYVAGLPEDFALPDDDSKEFKIWNKPSERILGLANEYKIKRLYIVSNRKKDVSEDIRGISIQRGGMKVCCIEPRYLQKDVADSIYGYVTLDEKVERSLLENKDEGPEHYSYDFRKTIPGAIKHYVEDEMNKFAEEKLGVGVNLQAIRRQKEAMAERKALEAINRMAKEIGLFGGGKGPKRPPRPSKGKHLEKEIYVEMEELEFPRAGDIQLHYEETLKNISACVFNDSKSSVKVKVKIYIRYDDKPIKVYADQDISLDSKESSEVFGPFEQKFTKKDFRETGKYTIVARVDSLMPANLHLTLDEEKRAIYLEEEPPARGLFEKCKPIGYGGEFTSIMGMAVRGERGGFIFEYNVEHPAEKAIEDDEDELAEYLFRLMAFELCRIDLQQEEPRMYENSDRTTEDDLLQRTLRNIGDLLCRYHSGGESECR